METRPPIVRMAGTRWRLAPPPATVVFRCDPLTGETCEITRDGSRLRWRDPLEALREIEMMVRESRWPDACCVGFISYELGRVFEERVRSTRGDSVDAPLFVFSFHASGDPRPPVLCEPARPAISLPTARAIDRDSFCTAVRRVKEYIAAGDVFQVNLAQQFTLPLSEPVESIAARLEHSAPSAYGALLDYGDLALISNSPELFLRVTPDRRVVTRPIKGTRPRGPGMRDALLHSKKDQAELAMIVDLERNDVGRVCKIGSVRVVEPRAIEEHPTVYHGVATIEGALRDEVSLVDLLRATFPCGSITGAPKIRAMQIIDELEPFSRGPYCGAIGYLARDGTIEFNVAIRTMVVKDEQVRICVGGGIVADSDPADEYEETLVKARAMFDAIGATPLNPRSSAFICG